MKFMTPMYSILPHGPRRRRSPASPRWRQRVPRMRLVKVDNVDAEASETRIQRPRQVDPRQADLIDGIAVAKRVLVATITGPAFPAAPEPRPMISSECPSA